jgi:hypothetical protein
MNWSKRISVLAVATEEARLHEQGELTRTGGLAGPRVPPGRPIL